MLTPHYPMTIWLSTIFHFSSWPCISPLSGARWQSLAARKRTCDVSLFVWIPLIHKWFRKMRHCAGTGVWHWWKWNCISLFCCEEQINFACTHRSQHTAAKGKTRRPGGQVMPQNRTDGKNGASEYFTSACQTLNRIFNWDMSSP